MEKFKTLVSKQFDRNILTAIFLTDKINHSILSFPAELCPCLTLPESFKSALAAMLDYTLLKDPVFLLIGVSNVFGMAGLYVPFVYLIDAAVQNVSSAVCYMIYL
jgi:hypothetical protein